jgi:hypothetical protein
VSDPTQTCSVCGNRETVRPDGRGFPPDIAARKLAKRCTADGHECIPEYRVGIQFPIPTAPFRELIPTTQTQETQR